MKLRTTFTWVIPGTVIPGTGLVGQGNGSAAFGHADLPRERSRRHVVSSSSASPRSAGTDQQGSEPRELCAPRKRMNVLYSMLRGPADRNRQPPSDSDQSS